jgi:hypothetical protein
MKSWIFIRLVWSCLEKKRRCALYLLTHCLLCDALALLVLLGGLGDGKTCSRKFTCQPIVAISMEVKAPEGGGGSGAYQGEETASASRPCPGP